MASVNNNYLRKIVNGLRKMKKKYITSEMLSSVIGIYPDVINEALSYFDPMVNMDYQYNLMDLLKQIEDYLGEKETPKKTVKKTSEKPQLEKLPYDSLNSFIYERMTIGGFMNRDVYLSDSDLRLMKKLITQEQAIRKQFEKTKKKRK